MRKAKANDGRLTYLIPAYNAGKYLTLSVNSCLVQDESIVQKVLVVNDGSSDGSAEELRSQFPDEARLRIIDQENQGESAAINRGIELVETSLVCILSADDLVLPGHAHLMVEAIESSKAVVAYPDWQIIAASGQTLSYVTTEEYSKQVLWEKWECLPGPGAVIRMESIRGALRPGMFRYIDDYAQWLLLSEIGEFVRVAAFLASWRKHNNQATQLGVREIRRERSRLMQMLIDGDFPCSPGTVSVEKMRVGLVIQDFMSGHSENVGFVKGQWSQVISKLAVIALRKPADFFVAMAKVSTHWFQK